MLLRFSASDFIASRRFCKKMRAWRCAFTGPIFLRYTEAEGDGGK